MTRDLLRPWRLVAGDLSLDFANTLGGRDFRKGPNQAGRILDESLLGYGDLLDWARFVGFFDPDHLRELVKLAAAKPARAAATNRRALALREVIDGIARALIARIDPSPADLDVLNGELRIAGGQREIARKGGEFSWTWLTPGARLDSILWPLSCAAAQLFVEGPLDRLKYCPAQACGWLFLDGTKNGGRRWCSMGDCGNLHKVRNYRRRAAKSGEDHH